ncbi:hypothetical protein [Kamptonema sp. UHCC 0994]|uniref:hypothetical protein n=1 Tax=Kamptonema sp. UHCC 0994 TaxID=3031329 RepID=UPI0023BAC153|nr:hypothetical protein [Kamptonema sp. UHCC 0994]MDF0556299.1 hypothetical protein [Kamptonema sp. UHCC 0994]
MLDDWELTDKNGKPLRGAAKNARLKKAAKDSLTKQLFDESSTVSPLMVEDLTILVLSQQSQVEQMKSELSRLEKQQLAQQVKSGFLSLNQAIFRGVFCGSFVALTLLIANPSFSLIHPRYLATAFLLGTGLGVTFPSGKSQS